MSEHVEQRFADHSTYLQIARALVATRQPGPALSRALALLKKSLVAADRAPVRAAILACVLLLPWPAAAQAPIDSAAPEPCWNVATDTPCETWAQRGTSLSIIAMVAASGADLAATSYGLGSGRIREGNPILALFVSPDHPALIGAVKMAITGAQIWGLMKLRATHPKLATGIALANVAVSSWAAWHNTHVLTRGGP